MLRSFKRLSIMATNPSKSIPIWFWNPDGTWQEFMSQWYPCTFKDDRISYDTTEMYMMYQKALLFGDEETAKKIKDAETPKEQKDLGRQVRNFDSNVWNENKVRIVEQGNYLKFTQSTATRDPSKDKALRDLLLSTGERELVEASPEDRIWGIGYSAEDAPNTDRSKWGQNLLGKVLMQVRSRIREDDSGRSSGVL